MLNKTIGYRFTFNAWLCSVLGLVSRLIIAAFIKYITSHAYTPVREIAESCKAGAGSNVILDPRKDT
jgi:inorganic pyrophosphatase